MLKIINIFLNYAESQCTSNTDRQLYLNKYKIDIISI